MSFEGKKAQLDLIDKTEGLPDLSKHLSALTNGAYEWLRILDEDEEQLKQYDPNYIKSVVNAVKFAAPNAEMNFEFLDSEDFKEEDTDEEENEDDTAEAREAHEAVRRNERRKTDDEDEQETGKGVRKTR